MKEKIIEHLTGTHVSALLVKSRSILPGNGNIFELRFLANGFSTFHPSQRRAHKDFRGIDHDESLRKAKQS